MGSSSLRDVTSLYKGTKKAAPCPTVKALLRSRAARYKTSQAANPTANKSNEKQKERDGTRSCGSLDTRYPQATALNLGIRRHAWLFPGRDGKKPGFVEGKGGEKAHGVYDWQTGRVGQMLDAWAGTSIIALGCIAQKMHIMLLPSHQLAIKSEGVTSWAAYHDIVAWRRSDHKEVRSCCRGRSSSIDIPRMPTTTTCSKTWVCQEPRSGRQKTSGGFEIQLGAMEKDG
ncbi:hypothetical protein V8F06_001627 [Rhypophila decipiens]